MLAHEIEALWANHASLADERGLRFQSRIDSNTRITTDVEELRIIVGNLFSNAARYTAPGGWIRVDQEGERTILRVLDSGPVVPAEQRERLFDRFWRADAARSEAGVHFGVGLALVRSSCERLGFEVAAEEHEGAMAFVVRRRT